MVRKPKKSVQTIFCKILEAFVIAVREGRLSYSYYIFFLSEVI